MKHDFYCMGGSGDWEVWACRKCGRIEIPTMFGFMWSDLLRRFSKRWHCPGVRRDNHVIQEEAA